MNQDWAAGKFQETAGKAQETAGRWAGDVRHEAEGIGRQMAGRAQQTYGEARDAARHAVEQQPLAALLIAGVIGFAIGALLGRR